MGVVQNEDAEEGRLAAENLCDLCTSFRLEKEVAFELGKREVLLRSLSPTGAVTLVIAPMIAQVTALSDCNSYAYNPL